MVPGTEATTDRMTFQNGEISRAGMLALRPLMMVTGKDRLTLLGR
jgi:hypothetical protein